MRKIIMSLLALSGIAAAVICFLALFSSAPPSVLMVSEFNTTGLNYLPLEGNVPSAFPIGSVPKGTRMVVVYEVEALGLRISSTPIYINRLPASVTVGMPLNKVSSTEQVEPGTVVQTQAAVDIMAQEHRLFQGELRVLSISRNGEITIRYDDSVRELQPGDCWSFVLIKNGAKVVRHEATENWENTVLDAYRRNIPMTRVDIRAIGRLGRATRGGNLQ